MSDLIAKPRFSCALSAQQTVLSIPGGIPIIHAGPGCASKGAAIAGHGGMQGEGYAGRTHISSTNTGESEVVFGGENRLRDVIEGALNIINGELFVALSGCTAGIIGDDVMQVAGEYKKAGYPVVGVDTAGFRGNSYFGHEVVVNGIIDQYIGNVTPKVEKGLVNVFTVVPFQDSFWRGDLETIKSLLEKIGLKVNILFGIESEGVAEWKKIPDAEFNLLLSPWVGLEIVKHLEKKYQTPFLHYSVLPVGAESTSKFLRTVGKYAGIEMDKVEAVIAKEEKRFYDYLISFSDFVAEQRNILPYELYVVADSAYAIGIADYFTNELGFIPSRVFITDDPPVDKEILVKKAIEEVIPEYVHTLRIEADGGLIIKEIEQCLGNSKKALIFGSYWERCIAHKTNNYFVHLSQPISSEIITSSSYLGYDGGLRLLEKVYSIAFNRGNLSSRTHVE